jgi:2'-5' RNA ligase
LNAAFGEGFAVAAAAPEARIAATAMTTKENLTTDPTATSVAAPPRGTRLSMATLDDHWTVTEPNWEPGRDRLQWHVTLERHPDIAPAATRLGRVLARPYLRPVPVDDLHLTVHDVAVEGRIADAVLDAVVEEARAACTTHPAVSLSASAPTLMRTAVVLPLDPPDAFDGVRAALHEADRRVRGEDAPSLPRGPAAAPHVTLAYASRPAVADDLETALARTAVDVSIVVRELCLVRLTRSYRWEVVARVELSG